MDARRGSELDQAFARYVAGRDPNDLALVFDRAAARLLLIGMHLLGDAAAAEDLLQETFLDAIRGADGFDASKPVMPWLLAIQTRRASKMRRGKSRVLQNRIEGDLDGQPAKSQGPSALVAEQEVVTQIAAAVESLPKPYREVLLLRLVHDLQPAEIAHTLDREVGTVHVQLHRGLERLRKILPKSLAGALALLVGAERGLAAVRQRVLPVVLPVVGGLWMKKLLAAAAAVLVLLATGTWALVGGNEEGIGSAVAIPEMTQVALGITEAAAVRADSMADSRGERQVVDVDTNQVGFTGRVVAAESGAAIEGAEVQLTFYAYGRPLPDTSEWKTPSVVLTGLDGRFATAIDSHYWMGIELWVKAAGRMDSMGGNIDLRGGLTHDVGDVEMHVGSEVSVRVRDERGEPVNGYSLYYRFQPGDLAKRREGLLGLTPVDGLGDVRAVTDAEGRLPVALLSPGRRKVELRFNFVTPMGFEFVGPEELLVRPGDAPRELEVRVKRLGPEQSISGKVVDLLGRPMPFFELEARFQENSSFYPFRSRHDGRFTSPTLGEGKRTFTIRPREWLHIEFVDSPGPFLVGTTGLELVVREIEEVQLTIEVVDQAGAEVDAFAYRCIPIRDTGFGSQTGIYDVDLVYNGFGDGLSVDGVHSGGRFELEGVMPGRYLLYVRGQEDRFAPLQSVMIDVLPGEAQIVRMILEEMHSWSVRVLDGEGAPVAGSKIELLKPFGGNEIRTGKSVVDIDPFYAGDSAIWGFRMDEAVSDDRGMAALDSAWTLKGAYLRVTGAAHRPLLLPVDDVALAELPREIITEGAAVLDGTIGPVDVVLSWGATEAKRREFGVKTTGADDLKRRMPKVVAMRPGGDPHGSDTAIASVDDQGRFRLESLAPGDWEILFNGGFLTAGSNLQYELGSVRDLRAGEIREVEFSVSGLEPACITGLVFVDDEVSVGAQLVLEGPITSYVEIGDDGRFHTKPLPSGRYVADLREASSSLSNWRIDANIPIDVAPGESIERVLRFHK